MHDVVDRMAGGFISVNDEALEREFEARLTESSTLAFRVAFGVLRHRQDAEDVAQEAFVRAYSGFSQLRNHDRFRAWLVRMTWRLAIDRQRGDRRRAARDRSAEAPRFA
jgi:RNA polymerase sigma factor (sigma-70 family)